MASRPGRRAEILHPKGVSEAMNVWDVFMFVIKSLPELFKLANLIIERRAVSGSRAKPIKAKNKRRPRSKGQRR